MKSINQMVLLIAILGILAVLISNPITVKPIFAAPPSPCIEHPFPWGCQDRECVNSPESSTIQCCWRDNANGGGNVCQTCDVDENGDIAGCTDVNPAFKGTPDSNSVAPPPSGKAPPSSTEKCPENVAVDKTGNCSPTTQLPDDTSDNDKPNLRSNVLNDLMFSQSQDSSTSDNQEEENN
jgi:hypothetical protein